MRVSLAVVVLATALSLGGCFEGPQGPPGPVGATGLHALRQECGANSNCDLTCSPGERMVSVTCPGGAISITRNADINSATCSNSPGPALALCMKQ